MMYRLMKFEEIVKIFLPNSSQEERVKKRLNYSD